MDIILAHNLEPGSICYVHLDGFGMDHSPVYKDHNYVKDERQCVQKVASGL